MVCYEGFHYFWDNNTFNYSSNSEVVDFLMNMTENRVWFNESKSTWNSKNDPEFVEILTRQGLSFTFNIIDAEDLMNFTVVSKDFKYRSNSTKFGEKPWTTRADETGGLSISLKKSRFLGEKNVKCRETALIIHDPYELPVSKQSQNFRYDKSLDVLITAEVIQTDEDLRHLSIDQRQCYFKDERNLKFFKVYTKNNCERECKTFIVFDACKCAPYYYIRNRTMNVCDVPGSECSLQFINIDFDHFEGLFESAGVCKCLPTCNSIIYSFEFVSSKYVANFSDE